MRRCLIVANQTLTTDALIRAVEDRIAAEPHEFHLVAPATPAQDEVDGPAAYASLGPSVTDRAYALAHRRGNDAHGLTPLLPAPVDVHAHRAIASGPGRPCRRRRPALTRRREDQRPVVRGAVGYGSAASASLRAPRRWIPSLS